MASGYHGKMARLEAFHGILFALPWIAGMLAFVAFPVGFSLVISLSQWDPYAPTDQIAFIGIDNYVRALTRDDLFWISLYNTFYYGLFAVPLGLIMSLALAMLLNQPVRGIALFRACFYVPSVVGGVATTVLWIYIFDPVFGPLNTMIHAVNQLLDASYILAFINIPEPGWLRDPAYAKPALILMSVWGAGGATMLIFLAGLQGIPAQLYEVAEIDGATRWRKFRAVTIPMLSPTIFFNLVIGLIAALQVFMQSYIFAGDKGGLNNSLLFYVIYLYRKGFTDYEFGYASALAWIFFAIVFLMTLSIVRSSKHWVYYEGDEPG